MQKDAIAASDIEAELEFGDSFLAKMPNTEQVGGLQKVGVRDVAVTERMSWKLPELMLGASSTACARYQTITAGDQP